MEAIANVQAFTAIGIGIIIAAGLFILGRSNTTAAPN